MFVSPLGGRLCAGLIRCANPKRDPPRVKPAVPGISCRRPTAGLRRLLRVRSHAQEDPMSLAPPEADELRALARELGIELSRDEAELYRNLMAGSMAAFAAIDAAPSGLPPVPERKWWEPQDDPHGAWYVRCEIRTRSDGPLAGLRFAAKDNVMVAGLPLLNGSPILEGYVAEVDATIVTRLLDAGAT